VFSTWNTPIVTIWTVANCSSVIGCQTVHPSKWSYSTQLSNKISELIWMWEESRSSWIVMTM
jgi:hypothetical protein